MKGNIDTLPAVREVVRRIAIDLSWMAESLRTAGILSVLLVAAFERFWRLNSLGYNSDEAVYAGQAASIAHDPLLSPFFPTFRAHPLLFQSILSVGFRFDLGEWFGRSLAASFGLATVYVVYRLGALVYGHRAGLVAALFMAVMPYHVIVSRQVLLDGPMVFFSTLALYLLARFAASGRPIWLHASAAALGLTIVTKETSILLIGAVYAFLALTPRVRVRPRDLAISVAVLVIVVAPYPLTVMFSGRSSTGHDYLAWQLFRRPNHSMLFYPANVPAAIGLPLIAVALLGLWALRGRASWSERLFLCWIVVTVAFFQLWPVKGFQYLLPVAPACALLAAGTLAGLRARRDWLRLAWAPVAVAVVAVLAVQSWQRIEPSASATFLAGSGGVPGGREAGRWIDRSTPRGSALMTLGPSMANILELYGHRRAYGLSVSPNPLHRNPAYEPIVNPDLLIRRSEIQYVVWDAYSSARTPFFTRKLLSYVDRYNGRAVHTESVTVTTRAGQEAQRPVIVVYQVRP